MDTEHIPEKPTPETPKQETDQAEQPKRQPESEPVHIKHAHKFVYGYLMLLVIAALVGFGTYWYRHHHKVAARTNNTTSTVRSASERPSSQPATDPYAGWKTFSNDQAGITFKYPADWVSKVTPNSTYTTDNTFAGTSGTITSPSGNTLYWIYQVAGGGDGSTCTPNPGDTPFAPGDKCESKQVLSVEQIPSVTPAPGQEANNLFRDNLYITETELSGGYTNQLTGKTIDGGPSYFMCLDPYYKPTIVNGISQNPQPKVGMSMGFELPCDYWKTGFNVMFPVKTKAALSSADAKTVRLIMKSFNSYSAHSPTDAVNVVQSVYNRALNYANSGHGASQGEIDSVQNDLSPALYSQLTKNEPGAGRDQILCDQVIPNSVIALLGDASNGTATVYANVTLSKNTWKVTTTVDLASLKITSISCPQ